MRRSVRNGLAVVGMAGGMWFLGHAVANADTVDPNASTPTQSADAANGTQQDSSATGSHDSTSGNSNDSTANAENKSVTAADTSANGGGGGDNTAAANTGAVPSQATLDQAAALVPQAQDKAKEQDKPAPPPTTVTTGDATVTQQANGGNVDNSGNANVDKGAVNQHASAQNNVSQTSDSTSGDKKHGDSTSGNENSSSANAENKDITKVDTNVSGGNGGSNDAYVNTGLIGVIFNCPQGQCVYNITTGSVTVNQQANGGNVSNSGNVNIGPAGQGPCKCQPTPPCPQAKPAVKKAVAPLKVSPAVLSSAQPTGQLAVTGADYAMPLTVGLLALGLGAGLTFAGRRRQTATV